MIHLYVWLRSFEGQPLPVGEILVAEPDVRRGGRLTGEFRYSSSYLDQRSSFALDPVNLPLSSSPAVAKNPSTGIHGVFEDSLPDAWGRAVMCRRYSVPKQKQRAANLLQLLGSEAMGALAYSATDQWSDALDLPQLPELADLVAAAERFETDPAAPMDELMGLFKAGSSPGGARPKSLVDDGNQHWLAKFASSKDDFDMVRVEAATLATAETAGIDVPEFTVKDLGVRRALLIKRFDVTPQGGRNHVVSMKTLLGAENYYHLGYSNMADIIRRISDQPANDLQMLLRQSVFNALIGNTDDHLKNFAMMKSECGWHLTQAYDLMPDTSNNREHVLHFGSAGNNPTLDSLRMLGKAFGVSPKMTRSIIDEGMNAARQFPDQCEKFAVPEKDAEILSRRMRLLY